MQMTVCSLCDVWDTGLQQAVGHTNEPKFILMFFFVCVHFTPMLGPSGLVMICSIIPLFSVKYM